MGKREIGIGQRLALGFGLVLSLLVLAVGVSLYVGQQERAATNYLTEQVVPRADVANDLETDYLYESAGASSYILTGDERGLADYHQGQSQTADAISRLDSLPKTSQGTVLFNEVSPLATSFAQSADKAIALRQQGRTQEAQQVLTQEMVPTRDQLISRVQAFVALQKGYSDQSKAEIDGLQTESARDSLAIALFALLCGVLLAYYTARSVQKPIQTLVSASDRLAGGEYDAAIQLAGGVAGEGAEGSRNEVLRLADRFRSAAKDLLLRERRLAAHARLSSVLASTLEVSRLAEDALGEMAGFAGAELGVVYAYDGEGDILREVASYRLADGVPHTIRLKSGLVGEAAASRNTMLVRDIPPDLPFKVSLGLDEFAPRWIVVVPMVSHDELVGVVLLGGLHGPDKEILESVENGAKQLAVSLQNGLAHQRIETQNEEIQAQNEELQSQSEEIQAQNEELISQSEEIQSQNEDLQSQNEEIRAQAEELVEQNRRLVAQAEQITRLQEIAQRLSRSLSPSEVLNQVVKAASDLTGSSLASVFLLDESRESFTVAAAVGLEEDQSDLRWLTREESLAGRVLSEGRTIPIEDVSSYPNVRFPLLAGGKAVGSIIVAPMIAQGESLGVVEVYYAEPRTFSGSDVEMMSALSSAAAVAVYNSRLFDTTARQKALLEGVLAGIPEAVFVSDSRGRVIMANDPARTMFGVRDGERLDSREPAAGGDSASETTLSGVTEMACSGQEVLEEQIRYWNRAAEQGGYAQVSAAPILEQGSVARVVVVASDISRLKAVEQAKDEFLSIASHELKSPLTSVKGYAQLLDRYMRSGTSRESMEKMTHIIVEQSDRVVKQVDRLLELSRLQMGKLVMRPEPVDLAELIKAEVQAVQVKTDNHHLVAELGEGLIGTWDRAYLGQVITNLLENAVRYSPSGGEVRVVGRRENGTVQLQVSDQGIGIPREMQTKVFERHFRTEDAKRVKADGMGIGLYLVQQIVLAHKGRIWVESEPGVGSTFTVELPTGPGMRPATGHLAEGQS